MFIKISRDSLDLIKCKVCSTEIFTKLFILKFVNSTITKKSNPKPLIPSVFIFYLNIYVIVYILTFLNIAEVYFNELIYTTCEKQFSEMSTNNYRNVLKFNSKMWSYL